MRPIPFEVRIDVALAGALAPPGNPPTEPGRQWVAEAVDRLIQHGAVLFKIGALRLGERDSSAVAERVLRIVCDELVDRGAPADLAVEIDEPDATEVEPGMATRDRVPHHDSQRTSYLTPSRLDVPSFDPAWRRYSADGYSSNTHKLYAGIVIHDPGDGLSITTFFNLLALLIDAYRHQVDRDPLPQPLAEWTAGNIRRAIARHAHHGSPYLTLAAMLGTPPSPALEAVSYRSFEANVDDQTLRRLPELHELCRRCPCGRCRGQTERLYCHTLDHATGLSWPETRTRHERWLSSERYDLLLWNNLTWIHGAVRGSANRTLRPVFLAARSDGTAYETWLANEWRRAITTANDPVGRR